MFSFCVEVTFTCLLKDCSTITMSVFITVQKDNIPAQEALKI